MQVEQANKMGSMPMGKLIFTMSIPAIVAMMIQALYNIVDSIFVAQIGHKALLSVSLAFPLQILQIAVAIGTGIGINSLLSRRLGEGNQEAAGDIAGQGILLGLASGFLFFLVSIFVVKPYFASFTNDIEVFEGSVTYTRIALGLSVFSMVGLNVEKSIQATGNMVIPMVQELAGAITNLILDPILIFGLLGAPKLGIAGAAIATVIGQSVNVCIGLFLLLYRKKIFHITIHHLRLKWKTICEIYKVGFPAIVMQAIAAVMLSGMNAIIYPLSDIAVAILSVYFKLQSFIFMPVFGLMQGAMPVFGYNFGARNKKRVFEAYRIIFTSAFCIMLTGTILFWTMPAQMLQMFHATPEMMHVGIPALRLISLSFVGAAFGIVNSTVFQAVGHGMASLIVSVARQLLVILPVAYMIATFTKDVRLVWLSFPIAEMVACILSFILLSRIYHQELKHLQ